MGCYDDKGNYDYHEFNEITIGDRGFDTAYILTSSFVDTLRFHPNWFQAGGKHASEVRMGGPV